MIAEAVTREVRIRAEPAVLAGFIAEEAPGTFPSGFDPLTSPRPRKE